MNDFSILAQVIVAVSIYYIWIFRFDNIEKEFKQYGLSTLTRSMVGSTKIAMSTLLLAGIWYPSLTIMPALVIAFLMLSAQYFHFKANNPWQKRLPSFVFLVLSLIIAAISAEVL
jgi:hypothetical protein